MFIALVLPCKRLHEPLSHQQQTAREGVGGVKLPSHTTSDAAESHRGCVAIQAHAVHEARNQRGDVRIVFLDRFQFHVRWSRNQRSGVYRGGAGVQAHAT